MTAEPVPRQPLDDGRIGRRLARIRELLARWAALRPGDGAVWRTGCSALTEAEAVQTETRLGLRLPENYRRYLLEFGEPARLLMAYDGRLVREQKGPRPAERAPGTMTVPCSWARPAATSWPGWCSTAPGRARCGSTASATTAS
ncbi:hypothetical protein ACFV4P_13550 [Kitasatospora sp. NPDC059795]|uniref:hypothetical protein n=1 Tax=Kitasatospora sp. NPDC059795 TaxID=3346949 RepID=UPI003652550F